MKVDNKKGFFKNHLIFKKKKKTFMEIVPTLYNYSTTYKTNTHIGLQCAYMRVHHFPESKLTVKTHSIQLKIYINKLVVLSHQDRHLSRATTPSVNRYY